MEEANRFFSKAPFFPRIYFCHARAQCYGIDGNIIADLPNKQFPMEKPRQSILELEGF